MVKQVLSWEMLMDVDVPVEGEVWALLMWLMHPGVSLK
jgi:hypothetical protein